MSVTKRFKYISTVCVHLERDGKTLLMNRINKQFADDMYCMPGGHMDGHESHVEAVIRETKEELGIDIKEEDLELFHISHSVYSGDEYIELVNYFFRARAWEGEPVNLEPHKCSSIDWIANDNLPDNLLINMRNAIGLEDGAPVTVKTYPLEDGKDLASLTNTFIKASGKKDKPKRYKPKRPKHKPPSLDK